MMTSELSGEFLNFGTFVFTIYVPHGKTCGMRWEMMLRAMTVAYCIPKGIHTGKSCRPQRVYFPSDASTVMPEHARVKDPFKIRGTPVVFIIITHKRFTDTVSDSTWRLFEK